MPDDNAKLAAISSRWATRLLFPLLLLSVLWIYKFSQQPGYPWGGDSALYIMHARNLATHHAYAQTPYAYDDEAWMEGTPTFPPGLPLLLAPVYAWSGLNLQVLRDYTLVLLVLSWIPVFFFFRRWLGPWLACLALAFMAINRWSLSLIHNVGSEQPYLLFSFAALCVVYWIYDTRRNETSPWVWGTVAAALAAYTDFTRSIGVALMVGIALYDLYRNRRPTRFLLMAAAVFVALVGIENLFLHSDTAYRTQFRFNLATNLRNTKDYVIASLELWVGMPGRRWPRIILWVFTSSIALLGGSRKFRREGPGPAEFYAVCYLAVLYFYWVANGRYLIPLMPIYFLYLFIGMRALWSRISPQPVLRYAMIAVLLLMSIASIGSVFRLDHRAMTDGVRTPTYLATIDFIRNRIPRNARIVSDSARFLALFTDRDSLYYPVQEDEPSIAAFFKRTRAGYVLITKHHEEDQTKLKPALAFQHWRRVFDNADYALYEAE